MQSAFNLTYREHLLTFAVHAGAVAEVSILIFLDLKTKKKPTSLFNASTNLCRQLKTVTPACSASYDALATTCKPVLGAEVLKQLPWELMRMDISIFSIPSCSWKGSPPFPDAPSEWAIFNGSSFSTPQHFFAAYHRLSCLTMSEQNGRQSVPVNIQIKKISSLAIKNSVDQPLSSVPITEQLTRV